MRKQKEQMDFDTFKKAVVSDILNYMSPEMQQLEIIETSVEKVNTTLTGLIFKKEGVTACPSIYVEDLYMDYLEEDDLKKVLQKGAMRICNGFEREIDLVDMLKKDMIKENIVFQLINTEKNEKLLADIPHRNFQDLSVIYSYVIEYQEEYSASVMIKNELLELLEMNEQQLYEMALVNTKRLFPTIIHASFPEEIMPPEYNMFLVSNQRNNQNGSASILYEEVIQKLEEKIKDDFYIIPSSICEVLVVSAKSFNSIELRQTVKDVNDTILNPKEFLSYNVYFYNRNTRKIEIAEMN